MKWTLRTLVRDNRGGSVGCGVMLVIHVSPSTPGALAVEWGEVEEEGWVPRDDDNNRNRGPGVGVAAALEAADAAMTHHIAMIRRTIIMNDEEEMREIEVANVTRAGCEKANVNQFELLRVLGQVRSNKTKYSRLRLCHCCS